MSEDVSLEEFRVLAEEWRGLPRDSVKYWSLLRDMRRFNDRQDKRNGKASSGS